MTMEITEAKSQNFPEQKSRVPFLVYQFVSRALAIVFTLTSLGLMVTNKQTTEVVGIKIDAKYSYSSAFKFFVAGNAVASVVSLLSLVYVFWPIRSRKNHLLLFIADLLVLLVTVAGCAAAASFGMVGKYGNNHTGWMPICGNFPAFCNRSQTSIGLAAAGIVLFLVITVSSVITATQQ